MALACSTVVIRHKLPWEPVPKELSRGLEHFGQLDCNWVWVAETAKGVTAVLVAAPCHGIALLMKLNAIPESPTWALVPLFRQFLREMKERGMVGYLCWFDKRREAERKLLSIARRASEHEEFEATLFAGKLPEGW